MERIKECCVRLAKVRVPSTGSSSTPPVNPRRKLHRCPGCDYTSNKSSNMKAHKIRKHTTDPADFPFVCQVCDAKFKAKQDEQRHAAKKHPGSVLNLSIWYPIFKKGAGVGVCSSLCRFIDVCTVSEKRSLLLHLHRKTKQ